MRVVVLFALGLGLGFPAAAAAEDPPLIEWSALLPGLTTTYTPSSANDCAAGRLACVDAAIREMDRRFARLANSCDHDAIFALSYLRTTEEYRRATTTPGFFEDPPFVNHEDALFARLYFEPYDRYHSGRMSGIPPAWRIAFDAAHNREVSALGNLALGMNAHIQRDLPFVLWSIGLVKPDGSSRKIDHDRVNRFLNRVPDELIPEIVQRFDPAIDDTNIPTNLDDILTFQIVPTWRELAWRNAERLATAPSPAARNAVAADIEFQAGLTAQLLKLLTSYPSRRDAGVRDTYCAAQEG